MAEKITVQNGPPSLNYDLRARVTSNIIFWSSIVATVTIIPIILFYTLTNLTKLEVGTILGISSLPGGLPTFVQLPFRIWKVWKQDGGDRRPLSGNAFDLFMWEYIINFVLLTIIYTVSTSIPIPGLFLMTPSILVANVSLQFFFSLLQLRIPIWLSSVPPGERMRPGGYYIMEDAVAVDGGGRSAFRKALKARYESSAIFRQLVREITIHWAIGGLLFIGVSAALAFTLPLNISFGTTLGWIPIWALTWFVLAYLWIQRRLRQEEEAFQTVIPIIKV